MSTFLFDSAFCTKEAGFIIISCDTLVSKFQFKIKIRNAGDDVTLNILKMINQR